MRTYDVMFRRGVFAPGTIRSTSSSSDFYATIKYEFEAANAVYVGYMQYAQEMTRYWSAGDSVAVLYDPGDPSRSCIVYR